MSQYRQPYDLPFSALAPPKQGGPLNDEFNQKRPAFAGPPSGLIQRDPKWVVFDPAGVLLVAAVEPQRQMLQLTTNGDKQWCGVMQNLQLPTVIGETVSYAIYSRMFFGYSPEFNTQIQCNAGLVLCEDLIGNPTGSFMFSAELLTVGQTGTPNVFEQAYICADYIAFDDAGTPQAEVFPVNGGLSRHRISQTLTAPDTYDVSVFTEQSPDGIGWMPCTNGAGGSIPYRQILLGARSVANVECTFYFDFLRVDQLDPAAQGAIPGFAQTLGSV